MTSVIVAAAALFGAALSPGSSVPPDDGPYRWVCAYLDSAPTVFGVMGLPVELAARDLDPSSSLKAVSDEISLGCPRHLPLVSSLGLVLG